MSDTREYHAEIENLGRRIRLKELAVNGGEGLDRDAEDLIHRHDGLRNALADHRSPARQTLDADLDALSAGFERRVAATERQFARTKSEDGAAHRRSSP